MKWDSDHLNDAYFEDATALGLIYHYVQMTIHRPFLTALLDDKKPSPLAFNSLAVCTTAARAASTILESRINRSKEVSVYPLVIGWTSGTVLLICIWGVKKNQMNVDIRGLVADVQRSIDNLQRSEDR